MRFRTFARAAVLSATGLFAAAPSGHADDHQCQKIGGGILTNFLDPSQCASPVGLCTDGIAIGDWRGSVGVQVLGIIGNVYHVRHHWVIDGGDTITLNDAYLTTFPTGDANRVLLDYLNGVDITGGTGRFAGAAGHLSAVFGAIDLQLGELTLRFSGDVCLAPVRPS